MFFDDLSTSTTKTKGLTLILVIFSAILMAIPFLITAMPLLIVFALVIAIFCFSVSSSLKFSALFGLTWGLVFFGLQSWWINSLNVYAGVWAGVGWLALIFIESAFMILFAISVKVIHKRKLSWGFSSLAIALIFVSVEIIRSLGVWAYPWGLVATPFVDIAPVANIASYLGWPGVSLFILLASGILSTYFIQEFEKRQALIKALFLVALLGIIVLGFKPESISRPKNIKVSVIQTNISMEEKWQRDKSNDNYEELKSLLEKVSPDTELIIGPETSIPGIYPNNKQLLRNLSEQVNGRLIIGSLRQKNGSTYNTVFEGTSTQDKNNLVLFGEFIPFDFLLDFIQPLNASLSPGKEQRLLDKVAVLICSESADWLYARQIGSKGADIIAVSTNDAWFKGTSLPAQHLQTSRMRAIENGRYLAMSANYGYSAIIDPSGKIIAKSKIGKPMVITKNISILKNKTFFSRYGFLLNLFFLISALIIFISIKLRPIKKLT